MSRSQIRCVVLCAVLMAFSRPAVQMAWASPNDTLLTIDVADTIGTAGTTVPVSIFLQNLTDSIAGFQISITLSRPDLMVFDTTVETTVTCLNPPTCTQLDTNIETVVPSTVQGTLIQNWDLAKAHTEGGTNIRLTGIADIDFNHYPQPILPFTNGVLMKVIAHVACDIPDTLSDRTVLLQVNPAGTIFTDPKGDTISAVRMVNGSVTVAFSVKGDLDHNQTFNVLDVVKEIGVAFRGAASPCPPGVDDLDCNGFVDILDVVKLISFVFRGGPQPIC
ncbi:MAG: hypothetical protein HY304_02270 [candidate division Zixibacteria bacterium]|nr:hypothetical protein [candidate division Zixibacteria bacterium]